MKYLTMIALLGSISVYAQNFSPSASGSSITSPAGSLPTSGQQNTGFPNTNTFNTAPTTVPTGGPSETTLLNGNTAIPSNNPTIQAQESTFENSTFPNNFNTTTSPGSGSSPGFGVGTGGSSSDIINQSSPIPSP
jgi:hypothetical protein